MAQSDDDALLASDILQAIKKREPNYPYANLTRYLDQLRNEERGSILRHDTVSGKYSFSNPFHKVSMKFLCQNYKGATNLGKVFSAVLEALSSVNVLLNKASNAIDASKK